MQEVEEVRYVASNLGLSVKDWIGSERNGRSTICCQQSGLECQRLEELEEVQEVEEIRFVASTLGLSVKDWKKWKKWKKYDLLPAIWA